MSLSNESNGTSIIEEETEMSVYKKDALNVVSFKTVYDEKDLEDSNRFPPDMAHQVFGDSESIFGYRSLSIRLNYLHNSARCFVDLHSSGKIPATEVCKADDIYKSLDPWLPENYTTNKADFLKLLKNEQHNQVFGEVLHEFQVNYKDFATIDGKNFQRSYKITQCDIKDNKFTDFHQRFETFIVWYIDAANFIDLEDERWMIFYVYEELTNAESNRSYTSPIGFCAVYKFFAYPSNIRARISQYFVLPTHQRKGIGSELYAAVAKAVTAIPEVIDITVEEPTATFQKIRDCYDAVLVHKELNKSGLASKLMNQKKVFELMRGLKICKRQCQKVYDVLGCLIAKRSNKDDYTQFVNTIRTRITNEIERESQGSKRLCNNARMVPTESVDEKAVIDSEFKRYLESVEVSVKCLVSRSLV